MTLTCITQIWQKTDYLSLDCDISDMNSHKLKAAIIRHDMTQIVRVCMSEFKLSFDLNLSLVGNHLFVAWFNITASIIFIQELPPILLILFPEFFLFLYSFHEAAHFMILDFWVSSTKVFQFNSSCTYSFSFPETFWLIFTSFSVYEFLSFYFLFSIFLLSFSFFFIHTACTILFMEISSFLKEAPFWHTFFNVFSEGGAFLTLFFPFICLFRRRSLFDSLFSLHLRSLFDSLFDFLSFTLFMKFSILTPFFFNLLLTFHFIS